jgi:hypothetical protein
MLLMAAVPAADNNTNDKAQNGPTVSDLEAKIKRLERRIEELEGQLNDRQDPQSGQLHDLRDRMKRDFGSGIDDIFDQMRRQMEEDFGGMPDPTIRQHMMPPMMGQKPRLGVQLEPVSDDLKERFKNDVKEGAFVMDVMPGSAAEKAGLLVGDCITSVSGKSTADVRAVMDAIRAAPGGKLELGVLRKGAEMKVTADVGSSEDQGWTQLPPPNGRWLGRGDKDPGNGNGNGNGNSTTESRTELKAGALEMSDELAKTLKLTDDQKTKMTEVLQKHSQAAADEVNASMQPRHFRGNNGWNLSFGSGVDNRAINRAVQKHVQEAESELKGTLNADQLVQWSEWRKTHNELMFSQHMKTESSGPATKGDVGF